MTTPVRFAVLSLLIVAFAIPLSATVTRDEGGLTFPVVADFTDHDGTVYTTHIRVFANTHTPVYVRFEWMSTDGESFEYVDVHNPIQNGAAGYRPLAYLALWRRETVTTAGALRLVPVDIDNKPIPGIEFSGSGRIYVVRQNGSSTNERIDGVPDRELYRIGTKRASGFAAIHPIAKDLRFFFFTNLDAQEHTYSAQVSASWVDQTEVKQWQWTGSITVQPNRTAMLMVPALPREASDARSFDGQYVFHVGGSFGCGDCGIGGYAGSFISMDGPSGDLRIHDVVD